MHIDISFHAIVRYAERISGINVEEIRYGMPDHQLAPILLEQGLDISPMLNALDKQSVQSLIMFGNGGEIAVKCDRFKMIIHRLVVTTVMPANWTNFGIGSEGFRNKVRRVEHYQEAA